MANTILQEVRIESLTLAHLEARVKRRIRSSLPRVRKGPHRIKPNFTGYGVHRGGITNGFCTQPSIPLPSASTLLLYSHLSILLLLSFIHSSSTTSSHPCQTPQGILHAAFMRLQRSQAHACFSCAAVPRDMFSMKLPQRF